MFPRFLALIPVVLTCLSLLGNDPPPADCNTRENCLALATSLERAGDLAKMRTINEVGARRFPNETAFLKNLARADVLEAHYRQACDRYERLVFLPHHTLDAESEFFWGRALHEQGDLAGAHWHWLLARSTSPALAGSVDEELVFDEAAARHWKQVLAALAPMDALNRRLEKAGLVEVIAWSRTGEVGKARDRLRQWRQAFPANLAFLHEARILGADSGQTGDSSAGDAESILDVVDQYLRIADYTDIVMLLGAPATEVALRSSPLLTYYRAYCLEKTGKPAAADYRTASAMGAGNVLPTRVSSLTVLTSALKVNPQDATALYLLGNLHMHLEMPLEAVDDWRRAVRGGLQTAEVYRNLAGALGNVLHDRNGSLAVLAEIRNRGWMTPQLESLEGRLAALPDPAIKPKPAATGAKAATGSTAGGAPVTPKPARPKPDLDKLNDDELARLAYDYLGDNDTDSALETVTLSRIKGLAANEPLRQAYYEVQLQRALSAARKKDCDTIGEQVAALTKPDPELAFTKQGGRDLFETPRVLFYAARAYGLCADAKPAGALWKQAAGKRAAADSIDAVFVTFARIQLLALAGKPVRPELEAAYHQAEAELKTAPDGHRGAAEYKLAMTLQSLGRLSDSDSHFQAAANDRTVHYLALLGIRDNDFARRGVK